MTRPLRARSPGPGLVALVVGVLLALLLTLFEAHRPDRAHPGGEDLTLGLNLLPDAVLSALPPHVTRLPPQPGALVYGPTAGAQAYAEPGAMVVSGRDNFADPAFADISAAGGHVLVYLDAVVDNPHGRYHAMLLRRSVCGPRVPPWPGGPRANDGRWVNDFRVGGVLQRKLPCVLERMVAENPHMAGFFADDVGSRSWFAGLDWQTFGTGNRRAYRAGAVALSRTFRRVADRHGLIVLVNGTWTGGSLAARGGGYPDRAVSGNALADGGTVEHHDGQLGYFGAYACSSQWATMSPVTLGRAVNFAITSSAMGTTEYAQSNCFAWVAQQRAYARAPTPWWPFHRTGLPTRVAY